MLRAPSAVWLADRLDFAPGMAAMLNRLGRDKDAVKQRFVASVEGKQGRHAVEFCGKAFVATAAVD